jgi:hypothetical protein
MIELMGKFNGESFYQRLTNILLKTSS